MYNSAKAAHIIAYLALKHEKRAIAMLKAVKLVYIADREAIREFAYPMLDEQRSSLRHGPVNSMTYDLIKGRVEDPEWSKILKPMTHATVPVIHVRENVTVDDLDELSDAEIEILDRVWERFKHMDRWDLVKWTHNPKNIPEWKDPNGSSTKIDVESIFKAVGYDDPSKQIDFLMERRHLNSLLKQLEMSAAG